MSLLDPWGILEKTKDVAQKATGYKNASDKRQATGLMNEQIKAYKDQSEITRQEADAKRDEGIAEKRKVDEKQIRALRRSYRTQGFLGAANNSGQADMDAKLGG